MNQTNQLLRAWLVLASCLAFAITMSAQVQTDTSTSSGTPTHDVQVDRGEVVLVNGNDLLVKMDNGELRHFPNIPESARITVNGTPMGIHDLKPGMKLERTITTTTTPKMVTTVQTVSGKVWHINPPTSVILTLENGENQQFKIPKGQKFSVDGQMLDAWGLKKGMKVSATKIVEVPETHVTQTKLLKGELPPPPPPPPDQPILVAVVTPIPQPAAAAPAELPKTGSLIPLAGLLGMLSLLSSLGLKTFFKN